MLITDARVILAPFVWKHPSDYGGYSPDGDYLIYSRHRDSTILDNWNYNQILTELDSMNPADWEEDKRCWGNDYNGAPCHDFRASHWAGGWIEYIIVKSNAPDDMLIRAAQFLYDLDQYPILDEMGYGEAQFEAVCDYWAQMSVSERVDLCREQGDSIFAARREGIPEGCYDHMSQWECFY